MPRPILAAPPKRSVSNSALDPGIEGRVDGVSGTSLRGKPRRMGVTR
jgi:hypothetical protein